MDVEVAVDIVKVMYDIVMGLPLSSGWIHQWLALSVQLISTVTVVKHASKNVSLHIPV